MPELQHAPFTFKVLWANERALIPYFNVFILRLTFEYLKEFRGASSKLIDLLTSLTMILNLKMPLKLFMW